MLFASAHKSASRKKWYVLVPLDGYPRFKYHSIALVLLYNMRLEGILYIEQFPSYTLLKIVQTLIIHNTIMKTYKPMITQHYLGVSSYQMPS